MGNLIQWLKTDIFPRYIFTLTISPDLALAGLVSLGQPRFGKWWKNRDGQITFARIESIQSTPFQTQTPAAMEVSLSTQIQSWPQTWKRSFDWFHLFWIAPWWSLGFFPMKPSISIGSRLTSALSMSAMKQQGLSSWDKSCLVLCELFPFSLKHQQDKFNDVATIC